MSEIEKITSDIDSRFKSLNSVQVSDVRVTRNEWAVIKHSVLARFKRDAEPVATSLADHSKGETGYVKFHKAVPWGTPLYTHPPMNTAERDALVARIDEALDIECSDLCSLFRDIRAHLVGGGK